MGFYNNITLAIVPGSFKPPHKGHWEMVNAACENADKVIVLISNISEKAILSRPASKTNLKPLEAIKNRFEKYMKSTGKYDDECKNAIDLMNGIVNPSDTSAQISLDKVFNTLNDLKEDFPELEDQLENFIDKLREKSFSSIRRTSTGTEITPEMSKKVFEIFVDACDLNDKVEVRVSEKPSPILEAYRIVNTECKDCKILFVCSKKGGDEARFSDIKQPEYNGNEIEAFPVDVKTDLSATTLRDNITSLQRDWFPEQLSDEEFDEITALLDGSIVTEDLDTRRKPIRKIADMKPQEFIRFLKEFLPLVKNGKVDLNDISITEKIDGSALRLLTIDGKMMFESSYSGVTTWEEVPFKDAAEYLYKTFSEKFENLSKEIKNDFKVVGELVWAGQTQDENTKITPVCASYLKQEFGRFGGMVIFDTLVRNGDEWIPSDEIEAKVAAFSNSDFSFHTRNEIDITGNVTFTLDADSLQELIKNPDFNKQRFLAKRDGEILEQIEKIKQSVCEQLQRNIDSTKGRFSDVGDLIEGIVIRIKSTGDQFGIFSNKYKLIKGGYWSAYQNFCSVVDEFYKSVFGCPTRSFLGRMIRKSKDPEEFRQKFEDLQSSSIENAKNAFTEIVNSNEIPREAKQTQISMAKRSIWKMSQSFDDFIEPYLQQQETSGAMVAESGNAIPNSARIKKENISLILDELQNNCFDILGLDRSAWKTLGSTGKKESSGDIDVGIELFRTGKSDEEVGKELEKICDRNGWIYNNRLNTGFKMFHIGIPIPNQDGEIAQVDLMNTDDLAYCDFSYYAPSPEESEYGGNNRSILMRAIIKACTMIPEGDETWQDEDGDSHPVNYRHISVGGHGFARVAKTHQGKRGFIKNPKKYFEEELTKDPQTAIDIIFGKGRYSVEDFSSFERMIAILSSPEFPFKDRLDKIKTAFKKSAENYQKSNPSYIVPDIDAMIP